MMRARKPLHPLEWYRDPDGRGVDARLHLLDGQILDSDEVPVSTVDDVELAGIERDEPIDHRHPPVVSTLLAGTAVLPRIFGGHVPPNRSERVSWNLVAQLGVTIRLSVRGEDLEATWIERWVRDQVISRIPGGRHAPE